MGRSKIWTDIFLLSVQKYLRPYIIHFIITLKVIKGALVFRSWSTAGKKIMSQNF